MKSREKGGAAKEILPFNIHINPTFPDLKVYLLLAFETDNFPDSTSRLDLKLKRKYFGPNN